MSASDKATYAPAYSLNEMLRANVSSVSNRVFPPGMREDAQTPRITITPLTPTEKRVGIGEGWGSTKGLYYDYIFRVNVWDKDPSRLETVCGEVMHAVWKNRGYIPTDATNAALGQFINLEVKGGGEITQNAARQLYQRTLNIHGIWISKSVETW